MSSIQSLFVVGTNSTTFWNEFTGSTMISGLGDGGETIITSDSESESFTSTASLSKLSKILLILSFVDNLGPETEIKCYRLE